MKEEEVDEVEEVEEEDEAAEEAEVVRQEVQGVEVVFQLTFHPQNCSVQHRSPSIGIILSDTCISCTYSSLNADVPCNRTKQLPGR